ncbi:unnamed protein product [Caenorhabditis brenneri]
MKSEKKSIFIHQYLYFQFDAAKNLSDMSFDVVGLIIERSDYKKQSIRRKTSKSLRALVDEQKPALQSSRISCYRDFIECSYNDSL